MAEDAVVLPGSDAPIPATKPWERQWTAEAPIEASIAAPAGKPWERFAAAGPKPWERKWAKPEAITAERPSPGMLDKIGQPVTDPKQAEAMAKAQGTGTLDYVKNIGAGMGERVLDLMGGFGDLLAATAPGPDSGIKYPYGSGDVQADLQKASQEMHDTSLGYKPGTTWDDVKKSPASNFIAFAVEQGLVSAPDMAAAVAALPAYIAARTGELADERAENNASQNATVDDLLATMPAATASAMLDRIGARSMFGLSEAAVQGIRQVPKEVAKSAVKEGATEAAQEGIEDVATTAGTKKGWQPADTAERMLAASLAGGFTGGVVRTGTGTLEAATHTDTPVTGDRSETVETENPQLTAPVTRDDGEGVDSPPSASSSSIAPEERAILRRTSIPDEDIDAMSREEVETKVAEARAAGVKVNGAMVRSAEQYQMPAAAPVPENVPVPAERPAEQPVDAKAAAQKLLQDYQTRKAREHEQDAQAEQAVQSVSPALSAAVMREAYEGGERAALPRPDVPAEARPDPKAVVARQIAEYRARSENLDQTLANVQPDLESAVRANLAENREEDARVDQALGAPLAVQVQRSLYEDTKGDGSRLAPKRVELPEHVDVAAQRVNTEPSEAQKEAGNYQKGHIKVGGLDITIENPKGSTRSGTSSSGQQWSVDMPAHYGYVKRSTGADGDHVDVYVGDNPASKRVYVVDQRDPATRRFDEHKAIMGVGSVSDARDLYARAFSDRSGADRIGAITPMSISEFKAWLREGDTTKPLRMGKGVRLNQDGFPVDLKGAVKKPDSLIEFLARKGGVREDRGELSTLGLRDRKTGFVVGAGPLIRPKGMHPDKAREAAAEAGYLPMESSLADFYDALDADARSGRQQFSQYDDDWAMAWRDGQGLEQQSADEDSARSTEQEVHDQLSAYGFPVEKSERFVSAVAREIDAGLPFEEAVESAYRDLATEALADQPSASVSDIPFFGDDLEVQPGTAPQRGEADRAVSERSAGAEEVRAEGIGDDRAVRGEDRPEAESGRSREDGGRSDRESPAERPPRVAEETGADNRPQLVIPGAERATDADIAQRRADAPLKPKAPQKDPGGLFSDEMDQADLLDFSVNPITQSDAFKEWFAGSKVVDEEGKPLVVYHGAKRSDRINESGKFDRKRATSGPMAFFTDDPEIASNYATSKEDTSLDDETHLAQRFQVKPKGARSTRPVDQVWYGLDYAERQKIASLAPRVTVDDDNNIILEEEGHDTGIGNYDYEIKQARGNHLAALAESWLHSGQLFNEEERFLEVLNLAGMTTPVTYVDPNASNPGVFPVHLAIRKPLDTDAIPAELIAALEKASRRQRAPQFDRGKDQWDKSVQNPRTWIERLNEDQRAGTTHAWTSIPDWVTDVLKNFGYDGIKDTGGKNGGNKHNVWIPFYETQVKSPFNRGTFDPTNPKISYSASPEGWDTADAGDPMPKLSEAEQKRLVEIVSRTAGIDPSFVDSIKIPAGTKGLAAWGKVDEDSTAAGFYSNMRDVITLALDTPAARAGKVAYHEAFHRLQNLFLKDTERKLLKVNEPRLRKMIADKGEYSAKTVEAMSRKEVEAEAFGIWADSQDNAGVHIGIRKVWKNIRDMLTRVRNYLKAQGYQTVEDVFGKAKSGELAKRGKVGGKVAGRVGLDYQPAWHGSPHRFDKFSTEHIGKGEGNQAFGWGLYFAQKKDIAEGYRKRLTTSTEWEKDGEPVQFGDFVTDVQTAVRMAARDKGVYPDQVRAIARDIVETMDEGAGRSAAYVERNYEAPRGYEDLWQAGLKAAKAYRKNKKPGRLFQVDVPEDNELIDWDKPLSKQPDLVKAKIRNAIEPLSEVSYDELVDAGQSFGEIYMGIQDGDVTDREISTALKDAGIPGHRFLDGGSRAAGDGTYNYVIYDDSRIDVLDSYSIVERAPDQPLKPKSAPAPAKPKARFSDRLAIVSKALAAKAKSKGGKYDRITEGDDETFGDFATRKVLDYLDPVLKMQQKVGVDLNDLSDAYLTARLAEGTIRHELHQVDEKYVQPAIKELAAVGATEKDLHEYLYAMHAPERNRVVGLRNEPDSDLYKAATDPSIRGASGMSTNEAKQVLADLAKDRQKFMGIRRAASHIRAMLDDGLKRQLKAGLINKATYDELTQQWQHYVPLRAESDTEGTGGGMPSKSRGFDVRGDEFKGATGRYTKADNVVNYAVNNAEQSIIRAEKNKAATAALRFINQFDPEGESIAKVYWSEDPEKLGDITKAPPVYKRVIGKDGKVTNRAVNAFQMKDDVLAAKVGGKTYYMQFADPKVGLALKKMTFGELGATMRMLKTVSNWQSLINTRANPAFIPINFLRDVQTGATIAMSKDFKAGEIAKMVGSIPKAWGALWRDARGKPGNGKWDKVVADFKANGGKISFDQYNTIEETAKKIQKDLAKASSQGVAGKTWRGFIDLVENLNDTIENGIRVTIYNAAIEQGKTPKRAAFLARDLTVDFQKKGEVTPHMNSLYTFFNASVQGNTNFAKALYKSRKVKVAMGALIMAGYAQHVINMALAGDDDDGENAYLKMLRNEPWTFERNIVLFLPGSKDYIKLPLGFGMNAFWHFGTQAGAVTTGDKDFLPAALDSTRVAFDAFNPLGSGGWVSMVLPSVIDPIWELGTNQNFAGNPIYPQENQFDPAPPPKSEQSFKSTSPLARWGAETLNEISGGSDKLPGAVDVYPDSLEYLWGWLTGGIGRFASQTVETGVRATDLEFEPKKTPFIRSFYGSVDDQGKRSEYFSQREKVQFVKGKMKEFQEAGDTEGLKDFMADHEQERRAIGAFDASEKMRRKINKQRRSLEKHDGSADRLKALDEHELEAMDRARKAFFEAGKKEP